MKFIDELLAKYGTDSIRSVASIEEPEIVGLSTGSLGLDINLDIGGIPVGRVTKLEGKPSSGKTTIANYIMADFLRRFAELRILLLDLEAGFDKRYMRICGIEDLSRVDVPNPSGKPFSAEELLSIARDALVSKDSVYGLVVIDSVDSLVPRDAFTEEIGDRKAREAQRRAQLVKAFLRQVSEALRVHQRTVVIISQVISDTSNQYIPTTTGTGGFGLEHYSSVVITLRPGRQLKDGGEVVGKEVVYKISKSKISPPLRTGTIYFTESIQPGLNQGYELFTLAQQMGVIFARGSYYYLQTDSDISIGQGKWTVVKQLMEDEELFETIKAETIARIREIRGGM